MAPARNDNREDDRSNPLSVEPLCGTLGTLDLYVEPLWNLEPFQIETFMWNLAEPGSRFPAAAPNHPKALLEEPQAFQAAGENKLPSPFSSFSN